MKYVASLIAVFGLFSLTGCALTVDTIPLNYAYTQSPSIDLSKYTDQPITVEIFTDSRSVEDPKILAHKKNAYGMTMSGGWAIEKPVAEVVRDAVKEGLKKANANLNSSKTGFVLQGEVRNLDIVGASHGAWNVLLTWKLTVKFTLMDDKTSRIIWRDSLTGQAEMVYKGELDQRPMIKKGFTLCLDALVNELIEDDFLRQQLKAARMN